jgi:hypothetical protein
VYEWGVFGCVSMGVFVCGGVCFSVCMCVRAKVREYVCLVCMCVSRVFVCVCEFLCVYVFFGLVFVRVSSSFIISI